MDPTAAESQPRAMLAQRKKCGATLAVIMCGVGSVMMPIGFMCMLEGAWISRNKKT